MFSSIKEKLKSPAITTPILVIFVIAAMQASKYALLTVDSETNLFLAVGVIQLVVLASGLLIIDIPEISPTSVQEILAVFTD